MTKQTTPNSFSTPTYRQLFGSTAYYTVPDWQSVLSPGAYFVDLRRLVSQFMQTFPPAISLATRRPDLLDLVLDEENTDTLVSKLKIVNEVIQNSLQLTSDVLDTTVYPFNFPYNEPWEQIRAYLAQNKTSLADICSDLAVPNTLPDPTSIALDTLGIAPEQWAIYSTPTIDPSSLYAYYYYDTSTPSDPLQTLCNIDNFLTQTGLPFAKLQELLFQDLSLAEKGLGINNDFYINATDEYLPPIAIGPQTIPIIVSSTGGSPGAAFIQVGEQVVFDVTSAVDDESGYGLYVAVVDETSGDVLVSRKYVTGTSTEANTKGLELFTSDITALPAGRIVAIAACGDAVDQLISSTPTPAQNAITHLGSKQVGSLTTSDSWGLIGVQGATSNSFLWEQKQSSGTAATTTATTPPPTLSIAQEGLTNLSYKRLDHINRFVRLAQALDWSFTDLDWALRTIGNIVYQGTPVINDAVAPYLAWMQTLKSNHKLSVNQCCALIGTLKDFGKKNGPSFFEQVFCNPNIPNLPQWADANNSYSLTWIVGDTSSASAQKIQNALTAVLKLNPERLLNIANRLVKAQDTTASSFKTLNSIKLSATNLAIFYRLSLLHQLTGMTIDKSWKAAKIVPPISQGLFSVINTDTSLLIGNELTIENPSDVSQNFFQGQITACTVQETTTSSTTVTITATTSDNTSHIITLELTGTNAPFAFTSISIDGSLQSSITAKNVDKYCLVNTSIESLLLSLAGSKAQLGINTLADFIAWLKNAPFSLAQLHFILTGKSDKVLGSDAIANFQENLNSSLPQIQLTKANFSNTCMTALQQAFSAVVNNKKFRKQLPIATLKDLDNAQAHASSYIQEIAKDIYTSLQPSYLTTNEIVVYGESVKKGHSTLDIEKIIKAAFTSIVNTIIGHQTKIVIPVDMPKTVKNHLAKTITTTLNRFYDLQQKTFIENLAALYQVSSPTAAVLVEWGDLNLQTLAKSSSVTMNSTSSLLNIMVHLNTSASSPTPGKATSQKFQEKKSVLQKLQQAAQLITVLSLSPAEASYFMAHYPVTAVYPISLETVQTMLEFTQLVQSFQDTQNNLLSFLQEASVNPAQDLTDSLAKLSDWNTEKIQFLHGILLFQGITPVYTVETITWMQKYFDTSEKLKLDIPTLYQQVVQVFANLPSDLTPSSIQGLADALWAGLQQQYSSQEDVLTRLQNHFNQTLRNRLVPLALVKLGLPNARALYEYLLIDVEVSGVVQTSYVKEAISAVQLYIYRCLNRLESGVLVDSELNTLWLWMYGYREWQANREVFLYPENYIQPELRKNKTDLFSQIESNLKQIDLTDPDSVAAAFLDYMNGFAEIAQLQIVGSAARDLMVDAIPTKQICMVGKSQQKQGSYYYRVATFNLPQDTDAYQPTDWGQWRKINIQIQPVTVNTDNGGVVPTFAFGTWYLFWVEQQQTGEDSSNNPLYTATIRYTHLDFRKNWVVAQTLVTCDLGIVRISSAFGTVYPVYFNSIQTIFVSFVPPSPPLPLPPLLPIPSPSQNTSNMLGTYTTYTLTANEWGQEVVAAYRFGTANPPTQDPRLNALSGSGSPSDPTFQYYKQLEDENKSEISSFSTWFCVSDTTKTSLLGDVVSIQAGNGGGLFLGNPSILVPNTSIVVKTWYHLAISGNSIYLNGAKTSDLPNNTINAATESGIYYLPSGKTTWSPSSGISSIYINCMYSFNNNLYAGTQERGVYYLLAGATTWIPSPGISSPTNTPTLIINCMYSFNNTLYAGTAKSGVYYLPAGATTWTPSPGISSIDINCMYSFNNTLYAGTEESGVYYLLAGATTWSPSPGTSSMTINCMYSLGSTLYAGTAGSGVYYLPSGKTTWSPSPGISSPTPTPTLIINCMYSFNNTLYAGTEESGVYLLTGATTWSPSPGTSSMTINCMYSFNNTLYAGTAGIGVYYLPAGATTWTPSPGISSMTINCMYSLGSTLYAGTQGGVYYLPSGKTTWTLSPGTSSSLQVNLMYGSVSMYNSFPSISSSFTGLTQETVYLQEPLSDSQILAIYNNSKDVFSRDIAATFDPSQALLSSPTTIPVVAQPNWTVVENNGAEYLLAYNTTENTLQCYRLNSNANKALGPILNGPNGIDGLLSIASQSLPEISFADLYPNSTYIPPSNYPSDQIDFTLNSAMSTYYWELFFHAPFLIANELNIQQQCPAAQQWYQYIFNPSVSQADWNLESDDGNPYDRFWRFLGLRSWDNPSLETELFEGPTQELLQDINDPQELYEFATDPYDPQEIASLRPIAYQKTIAMHYIDNLLSWGDMLFRENKRESIVEAEMLYVAAYDLLGQDPQNLGPTPSLSQSSPEMNWVQMLDLASYNIYSIYSYSGTLYVGTESNGLWSSTDNGSSWVKMPGIDDGAWIWGLCHYNDNLYAGTYSDTGTDKSGLFFWENDTWKKVPNAPSVHILCLYSYNGNLYMGGDEGDIYAYNSQWIKLTGITHAIMSLQSYNNTLYAWEYDTGPCCLDGTTWNPIPISSLPTPKKKGYLCVHNDTLYVGANNQVYSLDGQNKKWNQVTNFSITTSIGYLYCYNDTLYVATDKGLYNSPDGTTWNLEPTSPTSTVYYLYSTNNTLYAGTYGNGLWSSAPSLPVPPPVTNWVPMPDLASYLIYSIYSDSGTLYAGTGSNGLWCSTDNGSSWVKMPGIDDDAIVNGVCRYNGTLYAGTYNSGILAWENDSWEPPPKNTPSFTIQCLYSYSGNLYVGTTHGVSALTNGKWTSFTGHGDFTNLHGYNNTLYAWDYYTGPYYLEGTTLKSLPLPNLPSPSMNGYFCVHNDTLYLGAKKGIHSLDIQNKEWNQVTNFSTPVTTISYLYCYNETLYAGTDQGLYTSQDGATWNPTPVSPKGTVSHLYSSNNILYAGTDGNGLWSSGSYFPIPTAPDFGIPRNQQFLSYWDTVKQRIYNIRHALTIDSQTDLLPLFQPAINPMDLVAAVASGEGVQDVLNSLNTTIPYYRFTVMVEKAKATTQTVIQLGQSLLAALEKKDAEQLALLYNSNQQNILNLTLNSKQDQISAAEQNLQALQASLKGATDREDHYADLISDGLSAAEIAQLALQAEAILVQAAAEGIKIASIVGYSVPVIFGVCDGGMKIGDAINQGANILEGLGNLANIGSNLSGTVASFQRRSEDWQLQQLLAQDDIAQIHLQTLAAQYQKSVAQQELTLLETEIKQNQSVASFYQNKFTNSQLYQWYIGQIGALYFQAYQLAHEIAIQAENAWTFEHIGRGGDVNSSSFVQPGYWNSLYQGLLAGQSLQLDLNRMEKAFTDQNERRLEITKTFSLAQIDAQALLTLKTTGTCVFDLTEKDFDFDFPGHYARQIKTLSLSVPMVIGPYQNIHATLTQLSNNIVIADDSSGQKAVSYLLDPKNHPLASSDALISDVRPNQQVALSHGVNDTGLFTLNFNDARYLPFEGTGVVSSWSLEIPHEENNFDFDNLSDIIMQLQYTALAGSSSFKGFVKKVRGSFSGTRLLSLSQVPGWQEFMGSSLKPLHIPITPAQLRANMSSYEVTSLSLYADGSGTVHKLKLHIPGFPLITFPDSNAGKQTWSGKAPLKKKKGQQNWSLTPTTAMPSTVNNLFLVIDFTAS